MNEIPIDEMNLIERIIIAQGGFYYQSFMQKGIGVKYMDGLYRCPLLVF